MNEGDTIQSVMLPEIGWGELSSSEMKKTKAQKKWVAWTCSACDLI